MDATSLLGRAVVDLTTATKIGRVDEVILDPCAGQLAGLIVVGPGGVLGGRPRRAVPAAAVHAVGPDAVTVRLAGATPEAVHAIATLPFLSHPRGRRSLPRRGTLRGTLRGGVIDEDGGRIAGYALAERGAPRLLAALLGGALGGGGAGRRLRADTELTLGPELVVVSDDALVELDPAAAALAERPAGAGDAPAALSQPRGARPPAIAGDRPTSRSRLPSGPAAQPDGQPRGAAELDATVGMPVVGR